MADPLETLVLPREAGVRAACFCKVWFYTIRQASERGRICALAGHTLLDFQQSNRTSSRVGLLTGLTHLYLNGNFLTALPDSVGALPQLQELCLDANKIERLPK